ncbi:MAG: phage holin family protein [Myxococcales bacterium]|jgi:putative membrane protein
MGILISWLILAIAVWVAAAIVPGVSVKGVWGAIVVAAIFGIVNWLIGWVFFFVIGIVTLGLGFLLAFVTRWIVDAIVLKLTDWLTDRLTIRGFGPALLAALVMSALGTFGEWLVRRLMG